MERIKQALERARRERETVSRRPALRTKGESVISPEAGIAYTQTRTVRIPTEAALRNRLLTQIGAEPVLAAYKMLRTQVLQRMREQGWSTLAITGPAPGEGKTLTAVNLALSLARKVTHTVLLVDIDLRRPTVQHYFDYAPSAGLSDYLRSDVPLQDILINPGVERLVILPGGTPVENSSETLSSPRMLRLVEELKTRYASRLVLFDLPPLLTADDALAFSPYADAVLIVVEEGKTRQEDLRRTLDLLEGAHVIGTVLNKSEERVIQGY
jgi:protein-tyrosine kinase